MVTSSGSLGRAVLDLDVDASKFDSGLDTAKGRVGGFFKNAVKIGALGAAATGAAGVGIVTASVKSVLDLERELRPMIERSNLGAESLQVLTKAAERLGSEDGLDGVADSSQELQLRLAEAIRYGTGPAVEAFEALGLAQTDLIRMSPEESFLAVIKALQGVENAADKKFLADELMGGSSEKLAGILNITAREFEALTGEIRENANIVSSEGLRSAAEFDEAWSELKWTLGGIGTTIAVAVLPKLTEFLNFVLDDVIPVVRSNLMPVFAELSEFWRSSLQPAFAAVIPVLREIWAVFRDSLLPVFLELWDSVGKAVIPILVELLAIFQEHILPLLRDYIIPIWADFVEKRLILIRWVYENVVGPALNAISNLLMEHVLPAIRDHVIPAIERFAREIMPLVKQVWSDIVQPALEALLTMLDVLLPTAIEYLQGVLEKLQGVFDSVFGWIRKDTEASSKGIGDSLGKVTDVLNSLWEAIMERVMPIWEELSEIFTTYVLPGILEIWVAFRDNLLPALRDDLLPFLQDNLLPVLAWLGETILASIIPAIRLLAQIFRYVVVPAIKLLIEILEFTIELLTGDFAGAFEEFGAIFEAIWDGIVGIAKAGVNQIIGFFNSLIGAWNSLQFELPSKTFSAFGKSITVGGGSIGTPNIPTIPVLDRGAIVTAPTIAGLAMNSRPEAVVPLDDIGPGRGIGGLEVHVHAENVYGYEQLTDVVAEGVTEARRQGLLD